MLVTAERLQSMWCADVGVEGCNVLRGGVVGSALKAQGEEQQRNEQAPGIARNDWVRSADEGRDAARDCPGCPALNRQNSSEQTEEGGKWRVRASEGKSREITHTEVD